VRAPEDIPSNSTTRQVPMISLRGSVHILITNPCEGITDEHIMEITIPCGITLGSSGADVADSRR